MNTNRRPVARWSVRATAAVLASVLAWLASGPVLGQEPAPAVPNAHLDRYVRAVRETPENAFYRYAAIQTARRLGVEAPSIALDVPNPDRWRGQIYEMTTGAWAIQETLQLDRLAGAGDVIGPSTVPVGSIEGVTTPPVPLDTLLAGRTPVIESLAGAVPHDFAYAHFPRVSAMRKVLDASGKWGGHLLAAYTLNGRDERLRQKIEGQLLLASSPELDPFYDLVTDGIAVAASDPFFAEGTDVTIVFRVRNQMLFGAKMDLGRRGAVAASTAKLSIVQEPYREWRIDGVSSADRSISSFEASKGDLAIVSSSMAALKRVADAADGVSPSLAGSDDFRAMRAALPYSATAEDGFLFISDAFVRRVVSPRLKIGEARRVRCAVSLQTAAYASLMFQAEQGRAPVSIAELAGSRYLERDSLRCPDGGVYALEAGTPSCSVHNRIGALTPNLELRLDSVSTEEAESYGRFREQYKTYWRRYIDPAGIRVRAGERLEVDARILPLVENSAYRGLLDFVGPGPVNLSTPQLPSAILTLDVKLPPPPEPGRDHFAYGVDSHELFGKALGDHFSIQVGDGEPPISTDLGRLLAETGFGRFDDWILFAPLVSALTLPTAVVVPVRDATSLGEILAQFRAKVASEAYKSDPWVRVEGYRIVEGGARQVEAVTVRFFVFQWRIYYAVVGDRFVMATSRQLIDDLEKAGPSPVAEGALRFEIAPSRWKRAATSMAMSYAEDSRRVCLVNLPWLNALRAASPVGARDLDDWAARMLGVRFVCPDNGRYAVGPSGDVECTLHGTRQAPRQGPRPQPGSPASFILERVRRLEATLSFTPDGIATRVVVE
ncbi:MAG: hypothetical protein IT175_04355 [Acidobacteria bacterium]|nr:hypothetical protein [Acidobacteriota bacterium]